MNRVHLVNVQPIIPFDVGAQAGQHAESNLFPKSIWDLGASKDLDYAKGVCFLNVKWYMISLSLKIWLTKKRFVYSFLIPAPIFSVIAD